MIAEAPTIAPRDPRLAPTILTVEGRYFDFERPRDGITLTAIARGLSNICRFNGQCPRFYSVAEHSVHVSHLLPPELQAYGLLHDAAEAFIGDVTKPLKNLLPDYRIIERRVEAAVLGRFGLSLPMPSGIKAADMAMLATEQRQLMRNFDPWIDTIDPADIILQLWSPDEAMARFLSRATELGIEDAVHG